MKGSVYDDYEVIEVLDRRNNNRYYRLKCKICGHEKECGASNLHRQDNHHSALNCHEDYYKQFVGKEFGDYRCEDVIYNKEKGGYETKLVCTICGHILMHQGSYINNRQHCASVCGKDFHKSLIGKIYGDLKIIGINGYRSGMLLYDCECVKCGVKTVEEMRALEGIIQHGKHCFKALPKDDLKKVISSRFQNMLYRCNNPACEEYKHYGGRGIKVMYDSAIDLYLEFKDELRERIKNEPLNQLTFDRIDVNGNYEPGNLRIVNQHIQNTNTTRKKIFIIEKGDNRVISDSAMECGRVLGINGRSVGNVVRGNSKSCGGWKLYRVVDKQEDINIVINNEGVTTNLIVSDNQRSVGRNSQCCSASLRLLCG